MLLPCCGSTLTLGTYLVMQHFPHRQDKLALSPIFSRGGTSSQPRVKYVFCGGGAKCTEDDMITEEVGRVQADWKK